jgi:ABC-type glycerol-3-phosphate transport system substrate-binding protein
VNLRTKPATRRSTLAAAAALAVASAALAAACGTGQTNGGTAAGGTARVVPPGKLVIWGATNDGGHWEGDSAKPFRTEFESMYPGVTIEPLRIVVAGTSYTHPDQKFLAAVAGGEGPDLYCSGSTGVMGDWGVRGVVQELDTRMKTSKVVKPDAFLPLMLEEGQWRGKTYALYQSADTRIFYWNKELYAAAGLDPEKAPDTWDDFASTITKTLKRDGSTITQLGFHPTANTVGAHYWEAWYWAAGGQYLSADGTKVAFNNETALKTFEWLLKLVSAQGGWDAIQQFTREAAAPTGQGGLFRIQKVASYIETSALRVLLETQTKDVRYGIGHIPKASTGKRGSVRGGFSLMIASGARQQDTAWKFVDYHMSPDTLAKWNDTYDRLPTTKAAAASPLFLRNDPIRKLQSDVAAYSQRIPAIHPAAVDIQAVNAPMATDILSGKASPKQALDNGAAQIQAILDKWKS